MPEFRVDHFKIRSINYFFRGKKRPLGLEAEVRFPQYVGSSGGCAGFIFITLGFYYSKKFSLLYNEIEYYQAIFKD